MRVTKDSGADWLGEIPANWEVSRIGACVTERRETVSATDFPALSVTKKGVVPQLDSAAKSDNLDGRKLIRKDDFVINSRSDRKGSSGVSDLDGSCSVVYTVLQLKRFLPAFAHHLFRSQPFQEEFYRWGTGIVDDLWSTRYSSMKQIPVPVPDLDEQRRIADFLDRETGKIDALIAKQEQLITTLDERRGAVISRAVTRGLLEDRPFRDSGVEWLGEIPADWDVRPCWSSFRRVKQTGFSEEELLSVYRDHGVVPKSSRDDNHNVESEDLTSYQLVRVGDMVMNKMKAWQGSIALSDHRGIVSPAYFVYRPTQEFSRKYFHYLLRSVPYVAQYNRISKGIRVGQWDLDPTYFRTTSLIVPPVEEQRRIADFLDSETARFDQLRAEVTRMIGILAERRQALISAAVTGKLEVGV